MIRKPPLVSVVIPAYNAAKCLPDAVASIRRQEQNVLEIIIVDDGSTDATPEIISQSGHNVVSVRQQNAGPAAARNRGLTDARGAFIAFLDADDIWADHAVDAHLSSLVRDPQAALTVGRTAATELKTAGADDPVSGYVPMVASALFRAEVFDSVGKFDESLRYSEDQDWFLRARERGLVIGTTNAVTLYYRRTPGSLTRDPAAPAGYELSRVLKRSLDRRRASSLELTPFPGQIRSAATPH